MGQSNSPSENYLFLNVMVNFVIVNQKLTGSALHIEKNQTILPIKQAVPTLYLKLLKATTRERKFMSNSLCSNDINYLFYTLQ